MGTLIKKMIAPVIVDAQPATERGSDDRAENGGDTEQRHGRTLFLFGECIEQDSLAAGLQSAPGQSLNDAEYDHLARG